MMLQDRGWLERQVRQLADALARVLRLRREERLVEAGATLDETHEELFGLPPHVLDALDVQSVAHLLGSSEKLRAWAELLAARAELLADAGDVEDAERLRARVAEARTIAGSPPDPR